ncbi:hypothetical protein HYPSUDRAFT_190082 [Hypholoma sublateritium FD-334 SS-4]|uniref:DUF6534 domain-containing protein n=1 Tax=Hypholoma sublateritium (strain FD-334 SS-4) TaxID=945553 RepID=A0A0D2NQY5_HYPSF|nr:hypothetical protein HYPSUDRAFT_190082 [Hypholoma sublateritium FD-334 SS-4]
MVDIHRTLGALMVGGIVAAIFSGIVTAQVFAYFKQYPEDRRSIKILVCSMFLDCCHTTSVGAALWDHLISHFGDLNRIDYIPWSLAITIALTAVITFLVHQFFAYRIYKFSKRKFIVVAPISILACGRLCFACLTTAKMIRLQSLRLFVRRYTWSFTCGLSLSALIDALITGLMCYYLMRSQSKNSSLNHVLDRLMLYTFENGSLTCAATIASLLCWLTMHTNLIFLGLHFVISKFYANSLLATLNTRKHLHNLGHHSHYSKSGERNVAIMFSHELSMAAGSQKNKDPQHMKIKIERTKLSVSDDVLQTDSESKPSSGLSTL